MKLFTARMYASYVLGANLRLVISLIMRWRNALTGRRSWGCSCLEVEVRNIPILRQDARLPLLRRRPQPARPWKRSTARAVSLSRTELTCHSCLSMSARQARPNCRRYGKKLRTGQPFMRDMHDTRKARRRKLIGCETESHTQHIASIEDHAHRWKITAASKSHGTTSTAHGANATTFCDTLPNSSPASRPLPRRPTTIRSACLSRADCMIAWAGSPDCTSVLTCVAPLVTAIPSPLDRGSSAAEIRT